MNNNAKLISNSEVIYLSVDKVIPNPYQPRKFFNKESIDELAKSIKEYGVMQPISVRLINGVSYELVSGERRLRATRSLGLATIPAIVININDQDTAMLAMIENIQREDLNYIEEAEGFKSLMEDYCFTQEELADKIGKKQSTIANKIRILKLSKKIHKFLIENELSERHARALLKLENEEDQLEILKKVVEKSLTVKKTEDLIEKMIIEKNSKNEEDKKNLKIKRFVKDIRLFSNTIKQSIEVMKESGFNTFYEINEVSNGYEINIKLFYSEEKDVDE